MKSWTDAAAADAVAHPGKPAEPAPAAPDFAVVLFAVPVLPATVARPAAPVVAEPLRPVAATPLEVMAVPVDNAVKDRLRGCARLPPLVADPVAAVAPDPPDPVEPDAPESV